MRCVDVDKVSLTILHPSGPGILNIVFAKCSKQLTNIPNQTLGILIDEYDEMVSQEDLTI